MNQIFRMVGGSDDIAPEIDFSEAQNRRYDWLTIGKALEGSTPITPEMMDDIDLLVRDYDGGLDILELDRWLVLSSQARELIGTLHVPDIVFLKMKVNGEQSHLLLVRNVIECLDLIRSKVKKIPGFPNRIMTVTKHAFCHEKIPEVSIFLVPECGKRVFVTRKVKEVIECSALRGFRFLDLE